MTLGFRPVHPSTATSDFASIRPDRAGAAGPRSRLDHGTKLVDGCTPLGWGPGWVVKWYPQAHEATLYFRGSHDGAAPKPSVGIGEPVQAIDRAANLGRAERRARTRVRLYASSNGIDKLLTLTYAPPFCFDPKQAYDDVRRFIRRLRHFLGERFPYVWVLELHKDGERLHVHLGVGRYIDKEDLAALWPHGFIDIRRIRTKPGSGERARTQKAAHYLSKYVGKAFDAPASGGATCGRHRYEVGQGFHLALPVPSSPRSPRLGRGSSTRSRASPRYSSGPPMTSAAGKAHHRGGSGGRGISRSRP